MWFKKLTGFHEGTASQVRQNLSLGNGKIKSLVNGEEFFHGELETPLLSELREAVKLINYPKGTLKVREIVADCQTLHANSENANALFQVASQFNLLEMTAPEITPEHGIDRYDTDPTQGPACAIAAGAGTIYRQYFVKLDGQLGQSEHRQIDCLSDIGKAWGNDHDRLWKMKNGYALATDKGLDEINSRITAASTTELDEWRGLLRIGIQWNTQITLNQAKHCVSQAYCSALPVAYSSLNATKWAPFAKLVLQASYESCICAGILNTIRHGNNSVYLTLLGGGAFGNDTAWIMEAIEYALNRYYDAPLDLAIVSFGRSNSDVQALIKKYGA